MLISLAGRSIAVSFYLVGYARLMMKKKQYKEAIKMFTESLDLAKEVYGMDHPQVSIALDSLSSSFVTNHS